MLQGGHCRGPLSHNSVVSKGHKNATTLLSGCFRSNNTEETPPPGRSTLFRRTSEQASPRAEVGECQRTCARHHHLRRSLHVLAFPIVFGCVRPPSGNIFLYWT